MKLGIINFLFIICLLILGCQSKLPTISGDLKRTYYSTGEIECEFQIDSNQNKKGDYKSFYKDGKLKEKSIWKNDSILIYEQCIYFPSGKIKEYNFYNPIGERRYSRIYDESGKLQKEKGDFLSHDEIPSNLLIKGDSIHIKIFIASPPDCKYEIFGINSAGKYDVNKKKIENYTNVIAFKLRKSGSFVFPYQIEFVDVNTHIKQTRNSEVSFSVVDSI